MDWLASVQMRRVGVGANVAITVALQFFAAGLALLLDSLGFSEATTVIVFVLGVLLTSVLTTAVQYCLVASVLSILCYNYFLVEPRFSFRIEGADVPGTMLAMFVVALVSGYVVRQMRLSAQASAEAQLRAQDERLRAELLRSVSHDLRTPLTSISGNADMLLDSSLQLDDESRRGLVADVYNDATWLTNVVENLLTITRIEEGKLSIRGTVELVDDVVESALAHVSSDVRQHELSFEPSGEMLLARMDAAMMVQVVVNLVNNAIHHTSHGSSILVSVERLPGRVAVSVCDDGPGIDEHDREHIFDEFYTSGNVLADGRRGIGLGLSLCKSIVEMHGGEIWVAAVEPHGAMFTFTLPLEELPQDGE